jgi:hypothetical protein
VGDEIRAEFGLIEFDLVTFERRINHSARRYSELVQAAAMS